MKVIITGASKGIGLELCRVALQKKFEVCAFARNASSSLGLKKLSSDFGENLQSFDLDVTSGEATNRILNAIKSWNCVDILINNAGVLEQDVTEEALMHSFRVNSVAPLLLTTALMPLLKASEKPVVASITSRMGSITDNGSGGYYGYRASKTALNMLNKSIAIDNPWLTAIVIHPGWVQTDMGGSAAPVAAVDSAQGIWNVIETARKKNSSSGNFFDYMGEVLPW